MHKAQKNLMKPKGSSVVMTETPFQKRHCCWFCGEPSHVDVIFPPNTHPNSYHETAYLLLSCPHPTISVPACGECKKFAHKAEVGNIWALNSFVKKQLLKHYAKDLAIGINWTQEELSTSEFEGGNFAGFAKSAWFIYEVAKARVSYSSWPLVAGGIILEHENSASECTESFLFDDVLYPSVDDAIEHYSNTFMLDQHYVKAVLKQISNENIDVSSFAKAVRFCRLLVGATPNERKLAFKKLVANLY